jgi:AraC-like DNA-binding protein
VPQQHELPSELIRLCTAFCLSARAFYVINTGFQKNFNDFVNAYRVADFQKKVNDPKLSHYTLLALAYECGFNSKSTFNRAVKKATGQLPSTFSIKML